MSQVIPPEIQASLDSLNLQATIISHRQLTEIFEQLATTGEFQRHRSRTTSIHILDDDSLLHVFHLYRPFLLGEDEDDNARLVGGMRLWVRGRWWYRLAHVCKRWRNVILGSASHLDLSLVCTYGTPIAKMLAHSPPLPLVLDYYEGRDITTEDEEGIILALKKHDRVRRVRLDARVASLQKFFAAMDEEYTTLEYLVLALEDNSTAMIFPESLQAPQLRHLRLQSFALPIGSRLLTTGVGLVTLNLVMVDPSTYFRPNTLLRLTSLIPQLEILSISFIFSIPNRDVERQLTRTPITGAPVTLPNLRLFQFHGVSSYLETLLYWITAPRLEKLEIQFFNQLTFFVPRLVHFMDLAESLRFDSVCITFSDKKVDVRVYLDGKSDIYALSIVIKCWHRDWQVSPMAQISNSLSHMFSTVEHLDLQHRVVGARGESSEEHNEIDRTEWRKLLRPFSNVKTLRIETGLVRELSHCLELKDGELPLEALPELQKLGYHESGDTGDAFNSFINARQNTVRPVTLFRLKPMPFGVIH